MFNITKYFIFVLALSLTSVYAQNSFAHTDDENLTGDDLNTDGSLSPQPPHVFTHVAFDGNLTGGDLKDNGSLPRQPVGAYKGINSVENLTVDDLNDDGSLSPN